MNIDIPHTLPTKDVHQIQIPRQNPKHAVHDCQIQKCEHYLDVCYHGNGFNAIRQFLTSVQAHGHCQAKKEVQRE